MSANEHRGEIELELGDKKIVLRPTYEALQAMERATGTRLIPLARRFGELDFGVSDIVAVISAAATEKPDKDIGRLVFEAGVAKVGIRISAFLAGALNGGNVGNGEAPETTPATS